MSVEEICTSPLNPSLGPRSLRNFTIVNVNQLKQRIVFKAPEDAVQCADPGCEVVFVNDRGERYGGFIEVIAHSADSRVCWCGVCFEPMNQDNMSSVSCEKSS